MVFTTEYKKLNKEQKEAVDTIEGPVMVIAGPGTGKTQILALRIANILTKTDTEPESILAITFTESGVTSMRKRLIGLIGVDAYRVSINTFHGFSNGVITEFPEHFERIVGARAITEVEKLSLVEEILEKEKLEYLKPFGRPDYYIKSIISSISDLKREGVSETDFASLLETEEKEFKELDVYHKKGKHEGQMKGVYRDQLKELGKNKELSKLYFLYQKKLVKDGLYDFDDMIIELIKALKEDKDLLFILQERYQYLLVDEHQDTNNAQNTLLELLMNFHQSPNIFVVGDEKQAIFRFQGASLENFLYFKELYKEAKLVSLVSNYRSTQLILSAAYSLLPGMTKTSLKSETKHEEKRVKFSSLRDLDQESIFVAEQIKEKIELGVSLSEIAVLYRDNRDVSGISQMLAKYEIPFVIESDEDIFLDSDVRSVLDLLISVSQYGSNEELVRALHADYLGFDPLDVYKLLGSSYNLFEVLDDKKVLEELRILNIDEVVNFGKLLKKWKKASVYSQATEMVEVVFKESGFVKHVLNQSNSAVSLGRVSRLFNEVKKLQAEHKELSLNDFVKYIQTLRDHGMKIKLSVKSDVQAVRLMTAHKSKGQEFEYVYIINANSGHWGSRRRFASIKLPERIARKLDKESSGDMDERNLFYVALTRAKKEVLITYPKFNLDGKELLPTQFLDEIGLENLEEVVTINKTDNELAEILIKSSSVKGILVSEKEYIQELFIQRGLSVTALNNYLTCPWRYFYSNLLRVPQASTLPSMYGSAVHEGLNMFFNSKKRDKDFLIDCFKKALSRQPLLEKDREDLLKKGEKALGGYFDTYKNSWVYTQENEFNISGVHYLVNELEVRLTGKIDKMEIDGDEVIVTDYKTSKPKSRNQILGETKDSNGDQFRQLSFYKLLLSLYKDGVYKMKEGVIDFIQPNDSGKYRRESFEIQEKDLEKLKQEIELMVNEVMEVKFWDKRCGDLKCEYCKLRY
ncbi:MAG: hypothetical protein COU06_00740 [Candidatus Harrisonbacteria bacterium CG10_big_fil_rev_8_21_14_0_10_38_8]|uniref:DNA 3'-5' helicase n=1 Tax=Candidatus Harrisonbacteria bacterium CG10_big_fil_rev_8_21_14_0_10_38_8 TaxID=1974582 RepID=A0A2M6WKG5_9BACT|nr:MAG: hypothetical protein COU06_00740 [Candidatus Harrisonbacteria bacterium CG10_big_fil_rev_8_21_14_0_10_38_8]